MENKTNTARDFFLYLFTTFAAYFLAVSLITMLWQYINYFFPGPYDYYGEGVSGAMRFAISSLIVVFPIYAWVMRFLSRDIDRVPEKKNFWVRRWLIYITLFVAAVTVVVDLVVLLNTFLGGDFTARFILKAVAILVVAALMFWYYLFNLRRGAGQANATRKTILWVASLLVLLLIVGAFFMIGSPASNLDRRYDEDRVWDLSSIQYQVLEYWRETGELPESLDALNDPLLGYENPKDPESDEAYGYSVVSDLSFELCANFATESEGDARSKSRYGFYDQDSRYFEHGIGENCFVRDIDPELHGGDFIDDVGGGLPQPVRAF